MMCGVKLFIHSQILILHSIMDVIIHSWWHWIQKGPLNVDDNKYRAPGIDNSVLGLKMSSLAFISISLCPFIYSKIYICT